MTTPSNALNITQTGIVKFDGTATFTGITLTQFNILVGAASNGITSVAPSATSGNPLVSQGAGSNPIFSATPTVTSMTITGTPSSGTDATNVTYVTNAIAAVNPATSVVAATTANLNATYLNGVSGIGATLTNAGSLIAFTVDGQSPTIGQRILVKNQSSTFQNGVYTVTTVGSGAIAWVLTRAIDYDQPSDINSTGVINVLNGTVNALTGWLINSTVTTVGTDAITYVQYNNAPITTTQFAVLVGAASNGIASVGPSATAGQALLSGGSAANPAYSTPTYPSVSGSSGKILISDGTNNIYSTPTYPNAASTALKHIKSDGTNFVTTTVTYPDASVTAGKVIISDGTNYIASTPTFPNASAQSGKIIQSDGTNWIASTPTFPSSSGGSGKIIYDNGTNFVESVPTFPASASATSRKIIVSDGTNWNASTETWAVPGTSGNVLTSDGTNWTSAAAPGGGILIASGQLTNSQIKNLHGTPIAAIAAPGSGKVIQIITMAGSLNYGGNNAFTAGASQTISLYYGTTTSYGTILRNTPLTATASQYQNNDSSGIFGGTALTNVSNVAVNLYNPIATEITGNAANDNTVDYVIEYKILTIP